MKLYLDNCIFNRPFDDQSKIKILLETEAKLKIQENIRLGTYELVWSYILDYENSKNPFRERREQIENWKRYASIDMEEEEVLVNLAKSLHQLGLKRFDALHLACAITSNADYFLTTDRGILKKSGVVTGIRIKDPIDFIKEVFP
ncbi:MAG: PIN domain-containing protein [Candidatus Competibacteraceae bacterium]|nr:PIN domain-containing protein [Candidatus Competibacteraceae bacterium]MBK8754849.1 PIN domain-containing protein [Candidatus Competibacteraceae bacterium]